jgi:hypothetical protein
VEKLVDQDHNLALIRLGLIDEHRSPLLNREAIARRSIQALKRLRINKDDAPFRSPDREAHPFHGLEIRSRIPGL